MHTITIAAKNYLSRAIVLAASYKLHNPNYEFTILIVDAKPGELAGNDDYRIATPWDLPLDLDEFRRMAMIYDITELSTSVKPWALQMLIDQGAEVATYLDPDIVVYDSLYEIEELSKKHGIVLTPHTITPMPRDGMRPTEADIMSAGVFNLGFISVGAQSKDILGWWQARLLRDSIAAPQQMLFVDQRWIDLLPGYFDHAVLRDPGYNVAYWNLDTRHLELRGGKVTANGRPLRFFHFSGYDPAKPWVLSKYVADNPRVVLSEHPVALELCNSYAESIRPSGQSAPHNYGYNSLNDGTPVPLSVRKVYRAALTDSELRGTDRPPIPFADDDADVIRWLREPVRTKGYLNRFLYGYWETRVDLRNAFPEPLGKDEVDLVNWAWASVSSDPGIVTSLLPSPTAPEQPKTVYSSEPGLSLAGYFLAELGVGQMGRLLVDGAQASGLPFSTIINRQTISRQNAFFDETTSIVRYPIVVAAVNADQFPLWASEAGPTLLSDSYVIGMWAWEIEDFPDHPGALELVDEIWTLSEFGRAAIAKATDKPVYVVPLPIPSPPPHHALDKELLGLPDGPYFLFVFDYMSVFERKNPLDVVIAFTSAFDIGEGPALIIKSINGDRSRADRDRLRLLCAKRRDIILIEEYLDEDVLSSLMGDAMAYVSLHRAEGYGLTMSEAMARAVPVIATGYSGNMDFMTTETALLVPYTLGPIPSGSEPYSTSSRWAQPDLRVASAHMRWVFTNQDEAAELGQRAQSHVAQVGKVDLLSRFLQERVAEIMASDPQVLSPASPPHGDQVVVDAISRAVDLINSPPDLGSPRRFPAIARRFRRLLLRVLAHHDEQMNLRLKAFTEALEQVNSKTDNASRNLDELSLRADEGLKVISGWSRADGASTFGKQDSIDQLSSQFGELSARYFDSASVVDLHSRQMEDVVVRLDGLTAVTSQIDFELEARPHSNDPTALLVTSQEGEITLGFVEGASSQADYASFEDTFRGSDQLISDRLRPYLPYVKDHSPVIDVGCGRGEFLDLLRENRISAMGIDLDESMLERCRARGLDVSNAEAVDHLNSLAPASVGAVTSFQVVEHITPTEIRALFKSTFNVLRAGGVMIAETVNPHSPAALKVFWLDLTHVRPLYPESLIFLARECGFARAEVFIPNVEGTLDEKLRHSGEYAIVAWKN